MNFGRVPVLLLPMSALFLGCGTGEMTVCPVGVEPPKIQVTADRTTLTPGDHVTFTTTISNPNSWPVNLYLGPSHSGIYFVNGSAFQGRPQNSATWDGANLIKPDWKTGFCGTGSYALIVAVPASGSIQYTATAVVKVSEKGPYLNFGGGDHDHLILQFPTDGKYAVRAAAHVPEGFRKNDDPEDARWLPKEHSIQSGYAPNHMSPYYWQGMFTSNEITLDISSKRKR
jgi:hypothetical protein